MVVFVLGVSVGTFPTKKSPGKTPHLRAESFRILLFVDVQNWLLLGWWIFGRIRIFQAFQLLLFRKVSKWPTNPWKLWFDIPGKQKLAIGGLSSYSWRFQVISWRIQLEADFFSSFHEVLSWGKTTFFLGHFLGGIPIYRGWILEVWHRLHMSGIWRFLKKMIFYPKFCDNSRWTSWMEEMSTWKSCSNHAAFTGYSGTWMEQPPQNGRVRKWFLASPLFKIIFALQYFREWRKLL